MFKKLIQTKFCDCGASLYKKMLKSDINKSFCERCGSILLKGPDKIIHYTLKQKQKVFPYEFNPIIILLL